MHEKVVLHVKNMNDFLLVSLPKEFLSSKNKQLLHHKTYAIIN